MSKGLAYLCEVSSSPLSLFAQCQVLQLESQLRAQNGLCDLGKSAQAQF